jgi:nitroreductase
MDLFEVVEKRRSIRAFQDRPIEREKLDRILQAANQAPSAGNLQAYAIFVAIGPAQRALLAAATLGQDFLAKAPVILVFCTHAARNAERYRQRGARLYALQDATIACTFAMLAATALGLGSVWVGAFDDDAVHAAIQAPEGMFPVAMLPLGYSAEEGQVRSRREIGDLVHVL